MAMTFGNGFHGAKRVNPTDIMDPLTMKTAMVPVNILIAN